MSLGAAYAQSITVSPSNGSVALSGTVQFKATVTGLTNHDVIWSAAGTVGGNATNGTISTTGLYTAPSAFPGQNPVQITATSKTNSTVKGSTFISILDHGPVITAVTPNPLNTGDITVTIVGKGFVQGATVRDSYNGTPVQLTTTSVSSTTITATGYQGSATTATFTVRNPSSVSSNAVTIPVGSGTGHTLSVVNGSGSGTYPSGQVVTITANAPGQGQSFSKWTGATVADPTKATTTVTMPNENITVTANYTGGSYTLTVVNGTGGGKYAAGAVVPISANAPPAGQSFNNWTGATVADPNASSTTLTMPSANTTVTANYMTPAVIPYPVTTHPRLWVTQSDLSRLRSWASAGNPIYAQGMVNVLNQAVNVYNTQFFPGGQPNPNWPDPGDTQGYTGYLTEQYGAILAFNSLIDPNASNRIKYAQYARNILMHAMNEAAKGVSSGQPFRDPLFAVYNRANGSGEQWPLIVDWIYSAKDAQGNLILTAADKLTIRNVFLQWANACINAYTTGGDHPAPIGATNTHQLLPSNLPYRMASNNYYLGHARLLTMMGLAMDPSDDPLVDPNSAASKLGNTIRSYILNANGAWLYQEYAMMGEPATVASQYAIPSNPTGAGYGLANGGLPPEGMLYGHSYAYILGQLLALQTAGFNDPNYSGPQIGLIGAPVWDRYVKGFLSSLTPSAFTPPSESYLGPIYQYAGYGDMLRTWATPDFMQPFALLTLLEGENNQTTHANASRWFAINGAEGGSGKLMQRVTQPWSWSSTQSILYFMLLDPAASAPTDPRPTYATTFVDPTQGRIVAHSDWSANNTMFDYKATWESINHQDGTAGQFELFRNGEWLTKEMSNYDNNAVGLTTVYHNTLALQNWCANGTPNLNWYEGGEWANGSQWILGLSAGDPTTISSSGAGYVYAASDLTPLYNRPNFWTPANGAVDIQQATRSIVWLNNDYIVTYDRATSTHAGLFKRYNLSMVTNPQISGRTATETLPSGQQLFVQTLLPASPTITSAFLANTLNPIAELEPTQYVMTVEDTSKPTDTRFLHVLQGANKGASMVKATYLTNSSGTAFDGASFGTMAVFFPTNSTGGFVSTKFVVPIAVKTLLITGLTPSATYGVTKSVGATAVTVTVNPSGAGATADSAGLLSISL
ncbi:MAG TPA: hypothetical protein VG944_02260 [Fimbriimonas sp.]|nr:hypothetical protein [Fimbriimonas sp.]